MTPPRTRPRRDQQVEQGPVRIQKALAAAGIGSRRAIEEMVAEGRIDVNGHVIRELPCFITPEDQVRIDGKPLRRTSPQEPVYWLLNKPRGVVCTQSDPDNRTRAIDLVPRTGQRIYCVGRLDAETTGLIILTNDGELTNALTHPSHGVEKTYVAEIEGRIDETDVDQLKSGMWLPEGKARVSHVKVIHRGSDSSRIEIRLREGRNRQIRPMLAKLGHKLRRIKRVSIGPISDSGLPLGAARQLHPAEVAKLRRAGAGQDRARRPKAPPAKQNS